MRYALNETRPVGLSFPVAALRSRESTGVGEFLDLPGLIPFYKATGLRIVQILPVNDSGSDPSPYSSLSAFALHPLYLRIGALPEASGRVKELAAMRRSYEGARRFPYARVLKDKLALLQSIFEASKAGIAKDASLAAWIVDNPWVRRYAVYKSLKAANGEASWKDWKRHRDPKEGLVDELWAKGSKDGSLLFHAWLQYRLDEQLDRASRELAEAGIALKGDLPILMNEDSAEVWALRRYFRTTLQAGAPPDMFSRQGQNWGFPVYDWEAIEADGFAFWKERLSRAAAYYQAYRIDHVLGFFRIWALGASELSGYLGRFIPGRSLSRAELLAMGFDNARLRWMSRPHVREAKLRAALDAGGADGPEIAAMAARVELLALDRIGDEPLFLFKEGIGGERDIAALDLPPAARNFLLDEWRDRALLEYEPDRFAPCWRFWEASCWESLSPMEKGILERAFESLRRESEEEWAAAGLRILGEMRDASDMLPCAEDLGAVPACVPGALSRLGILGLRVPRWTRRWELPGEPYLPLADYPEASVCAPSVHDTSTLREWWETEAGRYEFWEALGDGNPAPESYEPAFARRLLSMLAACRSSLLVLQLQDLLALGEAWRSKDPRDERVNVPGTVSDFNWTWRCPASFEELAGDSELVEAAGAVVAARRSRSTKAKGA